jgi:hypothetical protein
MLFPMELVKAISSLDEAMSYTILVPGVGKNQVICSFPSFDRWIGLDAVFSTISVIKFSTSLSGPSTDSKVFGTIFTVSITLFTGVQLKLC